MVVYGDLAPLRGMPLSQLELKAFTGALKPLGELTHIQELKLNSFMEKKWRLTDWADERFDKLDEETQDLLCYLKEKPLTPSELRRNLEVGATLARHDGRQETEQARSTESRKKMAAEIGKWLAKLEGEGLVQSMS